MKNCLAKIREKPYGGGIYPLPSPLVRLRVNTNRNVKFASLLVVSLAYTYILS